VLADSVGLAMLVVLDPDVELRADAAAVLPGIPQHVTGAEAVAAGPAVVPRGYLSLALTFEVADGKITRIDVIADPERLGRLTLAVLDDSG
jgi:hypothetical protein